jgi:hypothetical protein
MPLVRSDPGFGGFPVADGILLTNHHVSSSSEAAGTGANFEYEYKSGAPTSKLLPNPTRPVLREPGLTTHRCRRATASGGATLQRTGVATD